MVQQQRMSPSRNDSFQQAQQQQQSQQQVQQQQPQPQPQPQQQLQQQIVASMGKKSGNDVLICMMLNLFAGWNVICEEFKQELHQQHDNNNNTQPQLPPLPHLLEITMNFQDVFHHCNLGMGNLLFLFYAFCMAAHIKGNIAVHIQCEDARGLSFSFSFLEGGGVGLDDDVEASLPLLYPRLCLCSEFHY